MKLGQGTDDRYRPWCWRLGGFPLRSRPGFFDSSPRHGLAQSPPDFTPRAPRAPRSDQRWSCMAWHGKADQEVHDMTWIWHGYDMFIPSKSAEEMAGNRSDVPRHWFAGLQSDDKNGEKGWNMLKKCWVDDYWWLLMIIDDYCWLLMYIDVYWCMKQAGIKSAKSWETPDSSHSQASMYQVT